VGWVAGGESQELGRLADAAANVNEASGIGSELPRVDRGVRVHERGLAASCGDLPDRCATGMVGLEVEALAVARPAHVAHPVVEVVAGGEVTHVPARSIQNREP